MTFLELAQACFSDAPEEDLPTLAQAMMEGYIAGLRACSYRLGGIDYVCEGRHTKFLQDVIAAVRKRKGTI